MNLQMDDIFCSQDDITAWAGFFFLNPPGNDPLKHYIIPLTNAIVSCLCFSIRLFSWTQSLTEISFSFLTVHLFLPIILFI